MSPVILQGPFRKPRQMLADQHYDGHRSIHDDGVAEGLGLQAGPIEGPTHFSAFVPLLQQVWGHAWFERGCFSAHFLNMVVEGEPVRACVERPAPGALRTRAWAEKADGTPVLEASASLGDGPTLLDERLSQLRPPQRLVILADLRPGMTGLADELVRMDPDTPFGSLYPLSLADKLACITEPSTWYHDGSTSPWRRPIVPLEMVSVLAEYTAHQAGFPVKTPAVGLFADLEIRMIDGPLLVGQDYRLRRDIVALSESRRTESYWVRTRIYDATGTQEKARVLLNHAVMKHSYPDYPKV